MLPLKGNRTSEQKRLLDGRVDEALILVKLRGEFSGLVVPYLVRFFKKFYRHLSKPALIRRVHRALDRLKDKGLINSEVIGTYRFVKLTEAGYRAIPEAVDLIRKAGMHETLKKVISESKPLITIRLRASQEWWFVANKLLPKSPSRFSQFDKEVLNMSFETWKEGVEDRVLIFLDENGEYQFIEYTTRFTSETYVKQLLAKYDHAWKKATEEYDKAVFVTITLPPIIPLYIQKYAMSFLWHRIKAYLRKHYGFTPPHIYADEPQKCLSHHRHGILFGIPRIMDKNEFTRWLDNHLINFLSKMGYHIQKTVNNRLTEDQVKALNKLGKKLLKRYLIYKRKHLKYKGPINYLCKLIRKGNTWEWENPPPDYLKYVEKLQKKKNTFFDGASLSPADYLKKYLVKNLNAILEEDEEKSAEEEGGGDGNQKKEGVVVNKLAWYWLCRTRFYSVSPKFRMQAKEKPKQNWKFVLCTTKNDLDDFLSVIT